MATMAAFSLSAKEISMKMKWLSLCMTAIVFAACSADAQAGEKRAFAAFVPTMTNPYWVSELGRLGEILAENGHSLKIFDAQSDQTKQLAQVEDAISAGYDLFFISSFDADGVRPALEAANRAKIPVIAIDTSVSDINLVACQVTADNAQAGWLAGEELGKAMGGKGKVGIIGLSVNMDCRDRADNCKAALKKLYPAIEIAFEQDGNGTVDVALGIMDNMIQRHPDLGGFFGINDPTCFGAVATLESAGLLDKVKVASVDGSRDGVDAVREGRFISTSAQFPAKVAEVCARNAYRILAGETITPKSIKVPSILINKDNCDQLLGY